MKKIQFNHFASILIVLMIVLAACSGSPNSKLIGTWTAEDVSADVDTNQIGPEILDRTLDVYRSVNFEFFENDSMNLISDGSIHLGTWEYREDDAAIYMIMEGSRAPEPMKFADYKDGKLVSTNETGIGTIIVTYIKK